MAASSESPKPFVLVFTGRSGSTYCIRSLASHSQVRAEEEYLARFRAENRTAQEQMDVIERYYLGVPGPGIRAFGFKTKASDVLDPERFVQLIDQFGIRVLLLTRRNVIKQAVSLLRAIELNEATGEWNLLADKDRVRRVTIEPTELQSLADAFMAGSEAVLRYRELVKAPTIQLEYEDFLLKPETTFARIFEFLEVMPHPVRGATLKHTSDDLRDVLENFDELYDHFAGSPYQGMLSEVLV